MTPQPEYHAWKKRFIAERGHEPTPYDAWLASREEAPVASEQSAAYSDPACQQTQTRNKEWDAGFEAGQKVAAPPAAAPAAPSEVTALMKFYGVNSMDALIAAQARHIEKLQSKLPSVPSLASQRIREG